MWRGFYSLLKKDFRLMLSSKFFILAAGSLLLYSCYINFVYVNLDQDIYAVYLYDPLKIQVEASKEIIKADSRKDMEAECADGYSVGIDASGGRPEIYMVSSGSESIDNYRADYASSLLEPDAGEHVETIGDHSKVMKNRREITAEFLFFELAAVGFLGLASMLFKEKQMGVIRVHGTMPVDKSAYIISKLLLFLVSDLVFTALLTLINLGITKGAAVLPAALLQAGIMSAIMALVGLFSAICLGDFKQFSLLYLVLAVFITIPVFLAGQTGVTWDWINYHPMYHLFMAMKNAYFGTRAAGGIYYLVSAGVIILLFILVHRVLAREMAKEG